MDGEHYFRIAFAVCAFLFFVLLYNPGILLSVLLLVIAFTLYRSHFYDFEKNLTPSTK
jgi:hypothetical protein